MKYLTKKRILPWHNASANSNWTQSSGISIFFLRSRDSWAAESPGVGTKNEEQLDILRMFLSNVLFDEKLEQVWNLILKNYLIIHIEKTKESNV